MKTRRKEARIIIKAVASVKSRINLLWLTLIVSVCFSMPVKAQCEATNEAFKSGEHVMYDLYFNWKFVWIKAGLASLTTNATTYHSKPAYRFNLLSVSSKKIDFFFKMRDTLTCIVSEKLEPRYFRKGAEEGKRYTVDEAWFSYKDGLCFVNQKRTYRDGEIIETEYSDSRCVFDMLSILAQARSYDPNDYTIGQKINFPMATGRSQCAHDPCAHPVAGRGCRVLFRLLPARRVVDQPLVYGRRGGRAAQPAARAQPAAVCGEQRCLLA